MASKAKEIIAKAKQEEAAARAKKRQGEKQIRMEYAKAFLKYFPEAKDADDFEAFVAHVRELFDKGPLVDAARCEKFGRMLVQHYPKVACMTDEEVDDWIANFVASDSDNKEE